MDDRILLPELKAKLIMEDTAPVPEISTYSYWEIIPEPAGNKDTIKLVLDMMLEDLDSPDNYLVVAGDQKTYSLMVRLKSEYGNVYMYDFCIPLLGCWHTLKNFQHVLMKILWDAGLKDSGKITHKNASFQQALKECSNFDQTRPVHSTSRGSNLQISVGYFL